MEDEGLLSELKRNHEEIRGIFKRLVSLIEWDPDPASVSPLLRRLRNVLSSHIKDEDALFYPALRERAVKLKHDALLPALDLFSKAMKNVSRKEEEFFERYGEDGAIKEDLEGFKVTLLDLIEELEERIKSEEGSLFYIYRAYFLNNGK